MPRQRAAALVVVALVLSLSSQATGDDTGSAKLVVVSGRVMDLTCGVTGYASMGSWTNAANNSHITVAGKVPDCAVQCLKGGQPAALFDSKRKKILAVFACNPRRTLAEFAAREDVEVEGYWSSRASKDGLATFVPTQIREKGTKPWTVVDCATMHD